MIRKIVRAVKALVVRAVHHRQIGYITSTLRSDIKPCSGTARAERLPVDSCESDERSVVASHTSWGYVTQESLRPCLQYAVFQTRICCSSSKSLCSFWNSDLDCRGLSQVEGQFLPELSPEFLECSCKGAWSSSMSWLISTQEDSAAWLRWTRIRSSSKVCVNFSTRRVYVGVERTTIRARRWVSFVVRVTSITEIGAWKRTSVYFVLVARDGIRSKLGTALPPPKPFRQVRAGPRTDRCRVTIWFEAQSR